jgi:hypothetical protein
LSRLSIAAYVVLGNHQLEKIVKIVEKIENNRKKKEEKYFNLDVGVLEIIIIHLSE